MSTARVGIDLDLMDGDAVFNELKKIERELKSLTGGAHRIRLQSDVNKLKDELKALNADKLKIKADTKQADARINKLKRNIKQLNQMLATKTNLNGHPLNPSQIRKAQAALKRFNQELKATQTHKINLGADFQRVSVQAQAARQQIDMMNRAMQNVKPIKEIFTSATAKASHFGSALQTLGSGLNRLAQPARMLFGGTLFAAGYKMLNTATEGLASGLSRYDTMKKYPMMMAEYSKASYTAQQSINDLDKSVRELPTGLDEIVQMAQRYTLSLGDMKRGTQLAIATNNAFLASMATESQKYQGMMQLQDLMNGKKLNSREWMSLGASMGKAINEIGKEFGYTNENMGEFRQQLYGGKIDSKEFLDALVKVGTGTGKIAKMAELSKQTWEAFSANVRNAFSRMAAGIITSLDEVVKIATGGKFDSLNMLLADKVAPAIDKLTASAKDWIKAHPDEIIDFVNRVKALDWKGFGKGLLEGFELLAKVGLKLAEITSKLGAERVGKFMAWAGAIASGLTIIGSAFRGGRHAFGATFVGIIMALRALSGAGVGGKIFGKLTDMFKGMTGLGKAAKDADKATKGGKSLGNIKGNLAKWAKPLAGIGSVLAVIAATAGTIAISTKAIKSAIQDMGDISSDFYAVDWGVMAKVATGFGVFAGAVYKVGNKIGKAAAKDIKGVGFAALGTFIAGAFTSMVAGFGRLDVKLVKDSIKDMVTITNDAKTLGENVKALKDAKFNTGSAKNLAEQIYGVYEAMFNRGDRSLSEIKKNKVKKAQDAITAMKGIFDTLSGIAQSLPQAYEAMNKAMPKVSSHGRKTSPFTTFKEQVKSLFVGLNEILVSLNEDMLGGEFKAKQISGFADIMASVQSMFNSLNGFVSILPTLYDNMAEMGMNARGKGRNGQGGGMFDTLVTNIKSLLKGVGQIYQQVESSLNTGSFDTDALTTKLAQVAEGITSIRQIANRLNKLGGKGGGLAQWKGSGAANAVGNIKKMIGALNRALGDADLGGLKTKVNSFVSSVKSLLAQLKNLNGDGTNTVQVNVTIKGSVKGQNVVINKIKTAIQKIRAACKTVTITKKVNIKITRSVSIGGDAIPSTASLTGGAGTIGRGGGAGNSHNPHTGGYITPKSILYRASGGDVPKGTDTVRAWLTPGEYVHKKAAVDYFGKGFMQRINNLDINGALRELSAKASHYMNVNRGTTINNNTTNNTDFTQNVYTNNPAFAFKRSSRYVGAL